MVDGGRQANLSSGRHKLFTLPATSPSKNLDFDFSDRWDVPIGLKASVAIIIPIIASAMINKFVEGQRNRLLAL